MRMSRMCSRWGCSSWRSAAAWLLLAMAALGAQAQARTADDGPSWRGVTVTDVHGWTLREVTLAVTADGASLLVIRADGAEKPLAFGELAQVLAPDGSDITADVLAFDEGAVDEDPRATVPPAFRAPANPEFAPAPLGYGRRPRPEMRPQFGYALELGGGVANVAGDWFWGADDGGFVQAGVRLGLPERRYLHLIIRHQALGDRSYYVYDVGPYSYDLHMDSYQLLIGRRGPLREGSGVASAGYAEIGGGLMRITGDEGWFEGSISRFAFAMQAGLWLMATPDVGVDVGLHAFYKPGWLDDYEAGGTSLGLHVAGLFVR